MNDGTQDVYVVDRGNNRVEEFNSTGTSVIDEFNGSGTLAAKAKQPVAVVFPEKRRLEGLCS